MNQTASMHFKIGGISMGRGKNVTKEVSDKINELRINGYSVKEVQAMLGVSQSSVVRYTKSNATKKKSQYAR